MTVSLGSLWHMLLELVYLPMGTREEVSSKN